MNFNDLSWHDAIINNYVIDRTNPGNSDTILLEIEWPTGKVNKMLFEDVYWARLTLNFGIIASESVYSAFIGTEEDMDFINFYSKWKGLMKEVKLTCYVINTASTGSEIKILAKNFRIFD